MCDVTSIATIHLDKQNGRLTVSINSVANCKNCRVLFVWTRLLVDGSLPLPARWLEATVLFYIYATCTSTNLLYITMVRKPLLHAAHELT